MGIFTSANVLLDLPVGSWLGAETLHRDLRVAGVLLGVTMLGGGMFLVSARKV
jgi:hypothetical protein